MLKRDRVEVSALVIGATGEAKRKRGIVGVEHPATGIYIVHFMPEKPVRTDRYHFDVTIVNTDTFRVATLADSGGATLQVRIFDEAAMLADADFELAAEHV